MFHKKLKEHVLKLLNSDIRLDGRKALEYRPISLAVNVSKTAEGSAKVTIGDTEVIVGVKMEIGTPFPDTPDEGGIMVGAELLPLSNPEFELGPPGIEAIELARVVDRGIRESKALDFKKLCIEPGKKAWNLLIDICPINDDGNLFDASALGALAAVKAAYFPKYENEALDYREKTSKSPELQHEPISVTVLKVGDRFLLDPTLEEEKILDARLTAAVMEDDTLCAMQKGGDYALSPEDIEKMIDIAIKKSKELRKIFKGV